MTPILGYEECRETQQRTSWSAILSSGRLSQNACPDPEDGRNDLFPYYETVMEDDIAPQVSMYDLAVQRVDYRLTTLCAEL